MMCKSDNNAKPEPPAEVMSIIPTKSIEKRTAKNSKIVSAPVMTLPTNHEELNVWIEFERKLIYSKFSETEQNDEDGSISTFLNPNGEKMLQNMLNYAKDLEATFTNSTPTDIQDAREPVKPASENTDNVANCMKWLQDHSKGMTFHATYSMKKKEGEGYLHPIRGCSLLRVEFGNDNRRFFWIYSNEVADGFVNYVNELKIESHEMIMPTKSRFFLDIDLELEEDDKETLIQQLLNEDMRTDIYQLDSLATKLIDIYAEAIKYSLEDHAIDASEIGFDYCATTRNRHHKVSIHLITNMILTHAENKVLASNVKEMIEMNQEPLELDDYTASLLKNAIDDKQYRKHGSLALPYGWKKGYQTTFARKWAIPNQSHWLTRSDAWIANVDDMVSTNYDIKTVAQYSNKEASSDFVAAALQHVGSIPIYDAKYFDIDNLRGEGCFRRPSRTAPSHCKVCDKNHERDHNLLLIFNEEMGFATWKCNRAPESKAKRFYFVPKEIEVSDADLEDFVSKVDVNAQSELAEDLNKSINAEMVATKTLNAKEQKVIKDDNKNSNEEAYRLICDQMEKLPDDLFKTMIMDIDEFTTTRYWDSITDFAKGFRMCHAFLTNAMNPTIMFKKIDYSQYEDGDIMKTITYDIKTLKGQKDIAQIATFYVKHKDKWEKINLYRLYLCFWQSKTSYSCAKFMPHSPFVKPTCRNDNGCRILNTFPNWLHQYDAKFEIDMKIVDVWLNHALTVICDNDQEYYEYLMSWFASIIQKPSVKTGTIPLIKSKQRAGKGQFFSVFMNYVMNPNMCLFTGNMDDLIGSFNSLAENKLMIVLDEAVNAKDKQAVSKLKNMTTEALQTINEKFKAQKAVQSFSNFACLTNHDFDSMIEKDQGRFFPKEANSSRCYDVEYWKNYRSTLMNSNAGKHIFHWLCRRDIKEFNIRNIPRGDYEKELAKNQVNSTVKWMLSLREKLLDTADTNEYKYTTVECYDMYREWCPAHLGSKSSVVSETAFNKIVKEYLGELKQLRKVLDEDERREWQLRKGANLPEDPSKRCSIRLRHMSFDILNEHLSSVLTFKEQQEQIEA